MPDEVTSTTTEAVKKMSDGTVKISVERYEDLLQKAAAKPPVINKIIKTAEMAAEDNRLWGGTLMGLGASLFVVGALRYRAGMNL